MPEFISDLCLGGERAAQAAQGRVIEDAYGITGIFATGAVSAAASSRAVA